MMYKKTFVGVVSALGCMTLVGCGGGSDTPESSSSNPMSSTSSSSEAQFSSSSISSSLMLSSSSQDIVSSSQLQSSSQQQSSSQEQSSSQAQSSSEGNGFDLDASAPPSGNFDLQVWKLDTPRDEDGDGKGEEIKEGPLSSGFEDGDFFYTGDDGGMVFTATVAGGKTSSGTSYTRSELREMMRRGDTNYDTQGVGGNNWVFGSASDADRSNAGGVDGVLRGTLAVNHVTTTGDSGQIGRVIVGQIHGNDDEPARLYYRKLPGNTKGAIYLAHEPRTGDEQWYEMIGTRSSSADNPEDGIELGEVFSYEIRVEGDLLKVTIYRDGEDDVVQEVDMSESGFSDSGQYMYFKAGVYNQNNTGDDDDYVRATFYQLSQSHSDYEETTESSADASSSSSQSSVPGNVVNGLDPDSAPSGNFDLETWKLDTPRDEDGDGKGEEIKEGPLSSGFEDDDFFYTGADGGMVFIATVAGGKTSSGTSYTRSELREMLRRGDTNYDTQGVGGNNWVFGTASADDRSNAGGVDGVLQATLAVNHVTTTGDSGQIGRVIVGQIHANDDEPARLYYRKLPNNTKGAIYLAHEPRTGDEQWYEMIGTRSSSADNPEDGIALGEVFSYEIRVEGDLMTVTIFRDGKDDVVQEVDMSGSGFTESGQYMYYKAGVYNQNNTGNDDDYVQATFYSLSNEHSEDAQPVNPIEPAVTSLNSLQEMFDTEGDELSMDNGSLTFNALDSRYQSPNGNGWRHEMKIKQSLRADLNAKYEYFEADIEIDLSDGSKTIVAQTHGSTISTLMKVYVADTSEGGFDGPSNSVASDGIFDVFVRLRNMDGSEDKTLLGTMRSGESFNLKFTNDYGYMTVEAFGTTAEQQVLNDAATYFKFGNYLQAQDPETNEKPASSDLFEQFYQDNGITTSKVHMSNVHYSRN